MRVGEDEVGKSDDNESDSVVPSSRARDTQIFICDASAEAGRLLTALHARGYAIVDVPLGLLPNRVNYEVPQVVICDADAHEALGKLSEMLGVAGEPIAIALLAQPDGAIASSNTLRELASLTIARPIDIDTAVEKVSDLTGVPAKGSHRPRIGLPSRSPVLVASARKPYRSDGQHNARASSHPPEDDPDLNEELMWPTDPQPSRSPSSIDASRLAFDSSPGTSGGSSPPSSGRLSLSPETRAVLEEGRRKTRAYSHQSSPRPIRLAVAAQSANDDVRSEFLSALAEPLGEADLDDEGASEETSPGGRASDGRARTDGGPGTRADQTTNPKTSVASEKGSRTNPSGTAAHHPGTSVKAEANADDDDEPTNPGGKPPTQPPAAHEMPLHTEGSPGPPPLDDLSDLLGNKSSRPPASLPEISVPTERPGAPPSAPVDSPRTSQLIATVPPPTQGNRDLIPGSNPLPLSQPAPSLPASLAPEPAQFEQPAPRVTEKISFESTWNKEAALYTLARAIQERRSGAVAQQEGIGLRRIVLTDGDISTVTSTLESESLAHFLLIRGNITEDVLQSLGSIPGFGRHAGAAFIARGLLQQEDLWPILRSHAEWILGRALLSEEPTQHEQTVPARILEEPAVFGGAAGTEIYLEAVRRVISEDQAFELLGAGERVLGMGRHESLLGESALPPTDQQQALEAIGRPLAELKARRPDLLPVLLGLTYLDILSTGGDAPAPPSKPKENVEVRSREIDDEAFVTRVMSRRALIDDGDYFSILGIPHSATGYEIDRARDELLEEYSNHRLTPRTAHLQDDIELLRATIDEAHLVLRDDVRRMRYRAALEALPD